MRDTDLTGSTLARAKFAGADLTRSSFNSVRLGGVQLTGAKLDGVRLFHAQLTDVDVRPLCDAVHLRHSAPSYVDSRTVMGSYKHPGLKRFMQDCGIPAIFAEFMIECAHAEGEPLLRRMMQSTFISYGGPDEHFARKLYETLREHQVTVFFFPETATVGERINDEVQTDPAPRPNRSGLLPGGQPRLAERINRRVVADFRKTVRSQKAFDSAVSRLLDALKLRRPTTKPS